MTKILLLFKSFKKVIRDGVLYFLIGNVALNAITFITGVIIARFVDKVEYAKLSYTDNIMSYILILSGLGLTSAVLRICSLNIESSKKRAYYVYALKAGSVIQILFTIIIIIVFRFFLQPPFEGVNKLLLINLLYPAMIYIFVVNTNFIRSHYRNRMYFILSLLQVLIILFSLIVMSNSLTIIKIIEARYVALAIVIVISLVYIYKRINNKEKKIEILSFPEIKKFHILGITMVTAIFFSTIMPLNTTFLINNLIRDETITANWKIASSFPALVLIFTNAIIAFIFPKMASQSDNKKETWRKSRLIGIINFFSIGIIISLGIVFTPIILKVFYGTKYLDAIILMQRLWILYGLNSGIRLVPMSILSMIGEAKANALLTILVCVIEVIVDYLMIVIFGINGVLYSLMIIYIVTGVIYWAVLYKKTIKNKIIVNEINKNNSFNV